MRLSTLASGLFTLILAMQAQSARASITFEDLNTRNSFYFMGIHDDYQGFKWGYSQTPGLSSAVIPTDQSSGWASATATNPMAGPAPSNLSGSSYAWNYNGPQSLFIEFSTPHDVAGVLLAYGYGYTEAFNASTVQLFGYDAMDQLVATSAVLNLSSLFQYLSAGFTGITTLEFRADANNKWFSVDNIEVSPAVGAANVPEATSIATWCVLGAVGFAVASVRSKATKLQTIRQAA